MLQAVPSAVRRRAGWLIAVALVAGSACSGAEPPRVVPGPADSEQAAPELDRRDESRARQRDASVLYPHLEEEARREGVSLVPVLSQPIFVFGRPVAEAKVQPASLRLVTTVPERQDLTVQPLPSPAGTAAIAVIESTRFDDRWGTLTTPAQRTIFASFAADGSLGDWLVVVSDVDIVDGSDPVPVAAYRWPRVLVEEYAACGIPPQEIDGCTKTFYFSSETVLIGPGQTLVGR